MNIREGEKVTKSQTITEGQSQVVKEVELSRTRRETTKKTE